VSNGSRLCDRSQAGERLGLPGCDKRPGLLRKPGRSSDVVPADSYGPVVYVQLVVVSRLPAGSLIAVVPPVSRTV
jgi:hypothetical protein